MLYGLKVPVATPVLGSYYGRVVYSLTYPRFTFT